MRNAVTKREAFTLIELLVVIGIIGILATLIFSAVLSAMEKARQSRCLENLRQMGIALNTFLATHHEYPMASNFRNSEQEYSSHHERHWMGALFPQEFNIPIFDCPSARSDSGTDYGYNAWGFGGLIWKPILGLGGKGPGPYITGGIMESSYSPPVKESDVANPSEMLAIGDNLMGWNGVVREGAWVMNRGPDAARRDDFNLKRVDGRHRSRANVLFCDGHVESPTFEFLFQERSDAALKIWNRDNRPHRERLESGLSGD